MTDDKSGDDELGARRERKFTDWFRETFGDPTVEEEHAELPFEPDPNPPDLAKEHYEREHTLDQAWLGRAWKLLEQMRAEIVDPPCAVEAIKPWIHKMNAPIIGTNPAGRPVEVAVVPDPSAGVVPQPAVSAEVGRILNELKCSGALCEHCAHRGEW